MVAVISLLAFCSASKKQRMGKVMEYCGMILILAGGHQCAIPLTVMEAMCLI